MIWVFPEKEMQIFRNRSNHWNLQGKCIKTSHFPTQCVINERSFQHHMTTLVNITSIRHSQYWKNCGRIASEK